MNPLYFDHGATTPIRSEVRSAMEIIWNETIGNPGSLHDDGQKAADRVEAARSQAAQALGASPREILFTGGGTESNNLAILGAARHPRNNGRHIVTTAVEHPSVLLACRALEKEGFRVTVLPVDRDGLITPQQVEQALTPDTVLVSVMAANNEVGTIQPIAAIGKILRERNILFHTDAVQAVGKIPFSLKEWGVDLLSIGAHKIDGPKGTGLLYVRKGVRLAPLMHGGGQERGLRPGTLNTVGIVGLGVALTLACQEVNTANERWTRLRNHLWNRIQSEIGGVTLNGHPEQRLPHNLNISFDRVEGQAVMLELNRYGIAISSGSACSAGKHAPSHVLSAMGRPPEEAYQSLRITLGRETRQEDADRLADCLKEVITYLRSLIPGE
ncbi:cysteine desulfurase family protein [Desmospora profundinema]|uniref:cysteine desulfurase n=1 Tax=Desmospora profundinema TaxID=1571184 RepID=A0ABU1IRE1_9BACL|nr:cysteine desulfurase family protein [Desmospora profundinema]MDR6227359.1 cysteine desulfurase [Desmospora profundinema]